MKKDYAIETQPLREFTEKAYLDYAMYVILDRALPHLSDGLKPVQRRIVYAMSELGLKASAKYKKSARTVGDVLGKFHPHGDSACYEAMVLMAQSFSYRYPLIDGQGNWGSPDDPKSFAAMRYTEAKLAPYARILLEELGQGTVNWQANFDGTLKEPQLLPARLPNVLLNGATGIAVGMATDIPPHNLQEVVDACVLLLEKPKTTLAEIGDIIQGPDYPTSAEIITPKADIERLYETGQGSIRQRAVYVKEKDEIIITALPFQVSPAKVLEDIAGQMQAKKLPMVADLRDESDHENPIRLVIIPRSNRVDVSALMLHLFATTDLERSYRVNLNMIGIDGKPAVKNLLVILKEWLEYRSQTVRARLQYRLDKILERLHLLEGFTIAYLNIDEVIQIIREQDNPKAELIRRFKLSELQADAVLDMKLRHLAKLEEHKIQAETDELSTERKKLEQTLGSERRLKTLVASELKADAKSFANARRSPLVEREQAQAIREQDILPNEPMTVVVSNKGWVRAAKGHEVDPSELNFKAGDGLLAYARLKSNQQAVFFDSTGRAYSLAVHSLPSARGQGEPLTSRLKLSAGAVIVGCVSGEKESRILLACNNGYGFVTSGEELVSKNKNGKAVLKVPEGGKMLAPSQIVDTKKDNFAAVSMDGRLLQYPIKALPVLARGKGNKLMDIPTSEYKKQENAMLAVISLNPKQALIVTAGKRHIKLKPSDLKHYIGERGRKGLKLPRGYQRVDCIESDG